MEKMAALLDHEKAGLWIDHDKAQRDTLKLAPDYETSISSTSNTSVAFGGMTPPAPRAP
jgi:hypothetical protein